MNDVRIYCTSGVIYPVDEVFLQHPSGVMSMGYGGEPAKVYPKCEYCGTCAVEEVSNCSSCGAPLPWDKPCGRAA